MKTNVFSYIPPVSGNLGDFLDYFDKLTFYATDNNLQSFIGGDFNIDMSIDSVSKRKFSAVLNAAGFRNNICLPTRVTDYSSRVLDLILTNQDTPPIACGRIAVQISDHMSAFSVRAY